MTNKELIQGFLKFVEDKAEMCAPWCDKSDIVALCAGPKEGYMDDAMFISEDSTAILINAYLGSLKK